METRLSDRESDQYYDDLCIVVKGGSWTIRGG
jgi:hypothetical protein